MENEYTGCTEEYAARTHALKLDADSPRYIGRTQGYAGRSRPKHKTLIWLEDYKRNDMVLSSATISQRKKP